MVNRDFPWLEKTYDEKRRRTIDLTSRAVAQIRQENGRVSLSQIVAVSKKLDADGKGVSSSAVLSNAEAYGVYVAARDWKRLKPVPGLAKRHPLKMRIRADRDEKSLRARLRKLTKAELIDRLIDLEDSFSELQKVLITKKVDEAKKQLKDKL